LKTIIGNYCHCVYATSPLSLCRKKHPQRLTEAEQKNILKYATDKRFENYPLSAVYCQLLRDKQLHCHISTFYKYCRLLRITRKQKRFKKTYTPLATAKSLHMLHLDVTIFRTADNLK
jgi:putative transposase